MTERSFGNPSIDGAHAFRKILASMSRPGRPVAFKPDLEAPVPMFVTTAAIASTLCDYQTPVWLSPSLDSPAVRHYLRFHTSAPLTQNPREAVFAFADAWEAEVGLPSFCAGTHEYPDRSTTLVIQSDSFEAGALVNLTGPGVQHAQAAQVERLDEAFWHGVIANNAGYPVGIDFMFVTREALMSCPRSLHVRTKEVA